MVASTGLVISTVEAGEYVSEQLDMMRSNQLESLSTTGSTTSFNGGTSSSSSTVGSTTSFNGGTSSSSSTIGSTTSFNSPSSPPAMNMPNSNSMTIAPQSYKPMKICWMVLEDQICSGGD